MRVHHLGEVGSTNDHARELAAGGASAPFWVRADRQTGGRGRNGRVWTSEAGNLYCTGVIPTARPIRERHRYSFAASLAVSDVLNRNSVGNVELKWPNDVLVDDRKVGGILLESDGDTIIVGIGLNLAYHPEETRWPATHTAKHGWTPSVEDAFDAVSYAVMSRFGQSWDRIHRSWLVNACCIGEEFAIQDGQRTLVGTHAGLGEDGELLLKTAAGITPVRSGDLVRRT